MPETHMPAMTETREATDTRPTRGRAPLPCPLGQTFLSLDPVLAKARERPKAAFGKPTCAASAASRNWCRCMRCGQA